MYDLAPVSGLEASVTVEPGSSVLLADSGGVDPAEWVDELLVDGLERGEGAVVVSVDRPATAVLDGLDDDGLLDPQSVCVIDCAEAERSQQTLDNGVFVYSVASPDDLTGIGIGLSACFERLQAAGHDRSRVGFRSLRPVLKAAGEESTFKFAHVVSSRLGSAGFLGVFGLQQPYSPEAKRILREAFDRTVELRERESGVERRVQSRGHEPSAWHSLPLLDSSR